MRKTMALFLALSGLLTAGGALAENQYYTVNTPVSIEQNTVYSAVIDANEGWKWNISDHMDVTAWLVDVQGNPAFENQTGIATAQLIYGAAEGEEEEVPVALQIDIDAAKIEGFTHNGSFDLYVKPLGKGAIWAAGNNHGQYQNSAEKLGEIKIPEVVVDGEITGSANKTLELAQDSVKLTLATDGAASNNNLDLWEEMRICALMHKGNALDATVVPAESALYMATRGGALALGYDDVGSVREGFRADLILVDIDRPCYQPMTNLIHHIVYAGNSRDVVLTMVEGRIVCENGVVADIDPEELRVRAQRYYDDVFRL